MPRFAASPAWGTRNGTLAPLPGGQFMGIIAFIILGNPRRRDREDAAARRRPGRDHHHDAHRCRWSTDRRPSSSGRPLRTPTRSTSSSTSAPGSRRSSVRSSCSSIYRAVAGGGGTEQLSDASGPRSGPFRDLRAGHPLPRMPSLREKTSGSRPRGNMRTAVSPQPSSRQMYVRMRSACSPIS